MWSGHNAQRVHIHCRTQFWHIWFTAPSLSLYLSLFHSPSFSHTPTPQSITLSHTLLIGWIVLNGKKEREKRGGYERERDRWGEGGVKQMCQNYILQWIWTLCDEDRGNLKSVAVYQLFLIKVFNGLYKLVAIFFLGTWCLHFWGQRFGRHHLYVFKKGI